MRILLIEPPFERLMGFYRDYFPIGLTYVGASLREAGHQVLVYDAEHGEEEVYLSYSQRASRYSNYLEALGDESHPVWCEAKKVMQEFQPELVGISAMTVKYAPALLLARLSKEVNPSTTTVLGGPHPTILPEQVIDNATVDFVVRGEGEETMKELVALLAEKGKGTDSVLGLSFKVKGQFFHNPRRPLISDLNEIPFPARDLLWNPGSYSSEDMGLVMSSRGCPFNCTYCSTQCMWGRRVRFRSVDNVIEEVAHLASKLGVRQITFEDDSFTVDRRRVLEFCRKVSLVEPKIGWSAITRVDLLDEELLTEMKGAGCNHVRIGIESGSDRVLKAIKKGITTAQVKEAACMLRRKGMYWSAYFMVGLPMEEEEDIEASLKLMREISPPYSTLSVYTPYPGTELFDDVVAAGLASYDMDWSKASHHSPYNYFTIRISQERFQRLLGRVSREFDRHNRRPLALLSKAAGRSRIYLKDPRRFGVDFKKFLYWVGILKIRNRQT